MNKAFGIVNAGISTAMGIMQALAQYGPTPWGFAAAALAGVTGAIQIGAIAAKKFNPESPSDSGGSTPAIPSAPTTPDTQQQNAPQAPNFFGLGQNNLLTGGGSDQRVFVVESDISATQGRVAKIRERSTLGN